MPTCAGLMIQEFSGWSVHVPSFNSAQTHTNKKLWRKMAFAKWGFGCRLSNGKLGRAIARPIWGFDIANQKTHTHTRSNTQQHVVWMYEHMVCQSWQHALLSLAGDSMPVKVETLDILYGRLWCVQNTSNKDTRAWPTRVAYSLPILTRANNYPTS